MARDCIICRILQKVRVLNYARLRAIIRDCERLSQNNQSTPTLRVEGSNPFGHAKAKDHPNGWSLALAYRSRGFGAA